MGAGTTGRRPLSCSGAGCLPGPRCLFQLLRCSPIRWLRNYWVLDMLPSRAGNCTRRMRPRAQPRTFSCNEGGAGLRALACVASASCIFSDHASGSGCAHAAVELSRCRLEAGSEGQTRLWPSCEGGGGMVTNAGLSAPTSLHGSGQWAFCFWFIFSVSN